MPIKGFANVPKDIREWGTFFRGTVVTADSLMPATVDTAQVVDNAITDGKLRNSSALSVIGRPVNSVGDPSDLVAANDLDVMRRSGATIGFGGITSANITNFVEASQDAVGAALSSTSTIDLTYLDATPSITADVRADSIVNTLLANMADSTIKGRASGTGTGDPTDLTAAQVATIVSSAVATALNITSGTYTPTLTNVTNLDGSTAQQCRYMRVGNFVLVAGIANADPTALGACQLDISLPVASNFASLTDCAGVASCNSVTQPGSIAGETSNDRARMDWIATSTANVAMFFVFGYTVI